MRTRHRTIGQVIAAILVLASIPAALGQGGRPLDVPTMTSPLDERGIVIGTTRFGSGAFPAGSAVALRLNEAVETGLRGFTVYVDWPRLEPAPGIYEFDELLATLDGLNERGLRSFVNLTIGDIGEYIVPPEFSDGQGGLAEGVQLDDAEVVDRLIALLTALAPELEQRGVFALGLGNEIDDRLDGGFPDERAPYSALLAVAEAHLDSLEPGLAVGVTLTASAHRSESATLQDMRAVSDFVAVNYGPINPDWFVLDSTEIVADLNDVLASYGDAPVIVQELTCPSAASMNSSEAWQAECLALLLNALILDPRVRFVSIFSLEDFDAGECAQIQSAFEAILVDAPEDFAQRFFDYLCELGVIESDGTAKPAWEVLLQFAGQARFLRRSALRQSAVAPVSRADLIRDVRDRWQ